MTNIEVKIIKCPSCDNKIEDNGYVCIKCPKCGEVIYNNKRLKELRK